MPEFAEPVWLWALLALPLVVWLRIRARIAEPDFKRLAGTILRCLSIVLLLVALAGPLEKSTSSRTDIVFLLDVSRSIEQETIGDALAFINRAVAATDPQAHTGLVVFGANAAVERMLSESVQAFAEISVEVSRFGTDIARALEVAVGSFQSDGQRRVVLLSDGQENLGQALTAAAVAGSVGVTIDTIALPRGDNSNEVLIDDISAPLWVQQHEPFELEITIESQNLARTHLIVTRNGSPLDQAMLALQPGSNSYRFVDLADTPGLYEYEAIINSDLDQVPENNRYQTFVQVRGPPRVLHAVGDFESGRYITQALRTQGLQVTELAAANLPGSMHELVEYGLIILNNVSALDMSLAKMELIEEFVRDAGGGLVILGGDKSYGAGGYLGTPIERALPVTMDVKTEVEIPSLAVIIIIDKSGSMATDKKLAVAKDAAFSALQVLKPIDTVGVLAFAEEPDWSVAPRQVGDRRVIVERLRQVDSGGSTDLYAALEEAHRVMLTQTARIKHMILLSDGLSETEGDADALVSKIAEDGITLSAVAFGEDADQELMQSAAEVGGGRYYYTSDADNVPRIFTSETLVVARNLFVEQEVKPQLRYPGEMLKGFNTEDFPMLSGYQRIFAKPTAQVLLGAAEADPLLVAWRYGLGKSVAFASDLSGRWASNWVQWQEFSRLVAQIARWGMRQRGTERLLPQFQRSGQQVQIIVDALDRDDRFINGLELTGSVIDPARTTSGFTLQQISPGRYGGEFEVPDQGRYYVNLSGTAGELQVGPETFGLSVPYSPEYLSLGVNQQLLTAIAERTGGQLLPLNNRSIAAVTASDATKSSNRGTVWWPALLGALILLIIEIAVRKLPLPESWRLKLNSLQRRPAVVADNQPGYDELVADIAARREAHLNALRTDAGYDPDESSARARLYIAGERRNS